MAIEVKKISLWGTLDVKDVRALFAGGA